MQNQKESTKVEDGRLLRLTGNLEILHKQQKLAMRRLLLYLSMVRRTILYFLVLDVQIALWFYLENANATIEITELNLEQVAGRPHK